MLKLLLSFKEIYINNLKGAREVVSGLSTELSNFFRKCDTRNVVEKLLLNNAGQLQLVEKAGWNRKRKFV